MTENKVSQADTILTIWKGMRWTELMYQLSNCVVGEKIFYVAAGQIKSCGGSMWPPGHRLGMPGLDPYTRRLNVAPHTEI